MHEMIPHNQRKVRLANPVIPPIHNLTFLFQPAETIADVAFQKQVL